MNKTIPKKVVIGGTFDILHRGHEVFLKKAFSLGKVTIGVTSNKMAEKIKRRKVNSFESRKRELKKFLREKFSKNAEIIKIEDKFGPSLSEDFDYIVVSPETYKTALLINQKRQKADKKPIKIVRISFVLGKNGKPFSSTAEISKAKGGKLQRAKY